MKHTLIMPDEWLSLHSRQILPLAQDPWLLDTYLNSSGHIRFGTLLMDLDALSGVVAYKHTGDGVTTVTAACDRITIQHPLTEICDLELSGRVTYATGRSSMEITLQVAKAPKERKGLSTGFSLGHLLPSTETRLISSSSHNKRPSRNYQNISYYTETVCSHLVHSIFLSSCYLVFWGFFSFSFTALVLHAVALYGYCKCVPQKPHS